MRCNKNWFQGSTVPPKFLNFGFSCGQDRSILHTVSLNISILIWCQLQTNKNSTFLKNQNNPKYCQIAMWLFLCIFYQRGTRNCQVLLFFKKETEKFSGIYLDIFITSQILETKIKNGFEVCKILKNMQKIKYVECHMNLQPHQYLKLQLPHEKIFLFIHKILVANK